MTELKNCPFCGREPDVPEKSVDGYWIECSNPNCMALIESDTKEEAIKAWNTRMDGWIPVSKRLPEDKQYVLVDPPFVSGAFKDEPRHVLFWNKRLDRFQYYLGDSVHNAYDITHWRALPNGIH